MTDLVRQVARCTRGHDLALYAAGVTFYATFPTSSACAERPGTRALLPGALSP